MHVGMRDVKVILQDRDHDILGDLLTAQLECLQIALLQVRQRALDVFLAIVVKRQILIQDVQVSVRLQPLKILLCLEEVFDHLDHGLNYLEVSLKVFILQIHLVRVHILIPEGKKRSLMVNSQGKY
jgi:hypothetical protein